MSSHPILPAKYCTDCVLFDSKLLQIALVGLGIHPQNGQRDNFTHEQPSFDTNIFGLPVIVKSSLTSGFFQTFASTHHSSLMMPAWGASAVENDSKKTLINELTKNCKIWVRVLPRLSGEVTAKYWRHNKNLSPRCLETAHIFAWPSFMQSRNSADCLSPQKLGSDLRNVVCRSRILIEVSGFRRV